MAPTPRLTEPNLGVYHRRMPFHSQYCQDQWLDRYVFRGKRCGRFLDIGAYDGVTFSNTLYFEEELGWTGVACEPIPVIYRELLKNRWRRTACVPAAVSNRDGDAEWIDVDAQHVDVTVGLMRSGLAGTTVVPHGMPHGRSRVLTIHAQTLIDNFCQLPVDYFSLDVEGHEMVVLEAIDFSSFRPVAMTIESNGQLDEQVRLLGKHGYLLAQQLSPDGVFIRNDVYRSLPGAADGFASAII